MKIAVSLCEAQLQLYVGAARHGCGRAMRHVLRAELHELHRKTLINNLGPLDSRVGADSVARVDLRATGLQENLRGPLDRGSLPSSCCVPGSVSHSGLTCMADKASPTIHCERRKLLRNPLTPDQALA